MDGFGTVRGTWPSGLPAGVSYWTGTEVTDFPGYSWSVGVNGGDVYAYNIDQSSDYRVVCAP